MLAKRLRVLAPSSRVSVCWVDDQLAAPVCPQDELREEVHAQYESTKAREHNESELLRAKLKEVQPGAG